MHVLNIILFLAEVKLEYELKYFEFCIDYAHAVWIQCVNDYQLSFVCLHEQTREENVLIICLCRVHLTKTTSAVKPLEQTVTSNDV